MKRKIEKKREKALRFESILSKNPFVKTVPSSILKKCKKKDKLVAQPQDASNQVSFFNAYLVLLKLKYDVFCYLPRVLFALFSSRKEKAKSRGMVYLIYGTIKVILECLSCEILVDHIACFIL